MADGEVLTWDHGYPFPIHVNVEAIPPLSVDGGRPDAKDYARHYAEWFLSPQPGQPNRELHVTLIEAVLRDAFAGVIADERARLAREGADRLEAMVDRADEAIATVNAIRTAAAGTAAAERWERWDIGLAASIEIAHHLRTTDLIERLWWCDEHPSSNAGAIFRARHHP